MLNTDAIRKRFAEAIVGIRADGSMAILLEQATGDVYMDIVSGGRCSEENLTDVYTTLIRPGDRCEVSEDTLDTWHPAVFHGIGVLTNGTCDMNPFCAEMDNDGGEVDNYPFIRPLPKEHLANLCTCVQYTNGRPYHVLDPSCAIHGSNRPLPEPVANPELEQARKLVEEARRKLTEAEAKLAAASK